MSGRNADTRKSIEILSTRLETNRSLIRHLLGAAQLWQSFSDLLTTQYNLMVLLSKQQLASWSEGEAENGPIQLEFFAQLKTLEDRKQQIDDGLLRATDTLIQRVTNLISIDEGYRSRDQNESIKRLSWVTVRILLMR